MTIFETINYAKSEARKKNKNLLNNEYRILMAYTLNISISEVVVGGRYIEITKEQQQAFMKYIEEVFNGKPLQYITNKQPFLGNDFYVDENVLIPQPDTEVLVEQAMEKIEKIDGNVKVLDLCTGSGAIAISLKDKFKEKVQVFASDISEKAIDVAKRNCRDILGQEDNITFIKSNMFENINDKFDIIVSNPPYIKTDVINTLPPDVQNEPHLALDGGKDGLDFYRIINANADNYLLENGYLLLEIGFDQSEEVKNMFKGSECVKDYAGNDRVIIYKHND